MFVREKRIGAYTYLYLVETVREDGKTKQRIVRNLGRKEVIEARGDLDRLARSAARIDDYVFDRWRQGPGREVSADRGFPAVRAAVARKRLPRRGGGTTGRAAVRVR